MVTKKLVCFVAVLLLVITLTACGSKGRTHSGISKTEVSGSTVSGAASSGSDIQGDASRLPTVSGKTPSGSQDTLSSKPISDNSVSSKKTASSEPVFSLPAISEKSKVVPKGCVYTSVSGTKYTEGMTFPAISDGDEYTDRHYLYKYNYIADVSSAAKWKKASGTNGWGVRVLKTNLSEYDDLPDSINGRYVVYLNSTFETCYKLVKAPRLPKYTIYMEATFMMCDSLTSAPKIPEKVVSLKEAFAFCEKLTSAPVLPDEVTSLYETFKGCSSLAEAPEIPSSVTSMFNAFYDCVSLKTFKHIPLNVSDIQETFYGCSSLSGVIVIDAQPRFYDNAFTGTKKQIILEGLCPYLQTISVCSQGGEIVAPPDVIEE